MGMINFRCEECTLVYEVLHHERHDRVNGGILIERMRTHDESDDWHKCPCCGSEKITETLGGIGQGVELGGEGGVGKRYPYFDHGLGVYVRSHEHRKEQYKAHGMIPTDGETKGLFEELADRDAAEKADDERKWAAYVQEQREGPNREQYARVMAQAAETTEKQREREAKLRDKGRERAMEIRERQEHARRKKSHADR